MRNEIYASGDGSDGQRAPSNSWSAGWTKLYWDVKDYGWLYLCVTPFLF